MNHRIRGLDSIRFICALWVMFHHIGLPPVFAASHPQFQRLLESGVNGPAAVIIFFVISGFCIHFPYRNGERPALLPFYTRRLLRIGLPFVVAIPVCRLMGMEMGVMDTNIFWSLICEIIYYLLYPLLLLIRYRVGWRVLIAGSFALAALVTVAGHVIPGFNKTLLDNTLSNYSAFGNGFNWIVGLPCWLLGCLLAERYVKFAAPTLSRIWLWRGALWLGSVVTMLIRFHLPHGYTIGNPWSLNVFALLVFVYLGHEIAYFLKNDPPRWLEKAGMWSYSLYLMHLPAAGFVHKLAVFTQIPPVARPLVQILAGLIASYLFYIAIERPSHLVATAAGKRVKAAPPPRPPVSVAASE